MKKLILYISIITLLYCCGNADVNDPMGSKTAPQQVEVKEIKNTFGKTTIFYNRPNDENLKYVRAVYEPRPGIKREINASFYMDSLVLDGFDKATEYQVKLYSVSYGEVASEPVLVNATPLEPPYLSIQKSVQIKSTFGGINIQLNNPTEAQIAVGILKSNSEGEMSEIAVNYSVLDKLNFSIRNQEAIESTFGVFIRDRWGQISDTLKVTLTPIEESMCDKKAFKNMKLPGDTYECHSWGGASVNNRLELAWNDKINEDTPVFHTKATDPMPQHVSIDLGEKYALSRLEIYPRGKSSNYKFVWASGWPKAIEIWGSNSPEASNLNPNTDPTYWQSWNLVKKYDIVRPSGEEEPADVVPLTDDDKRTLTKGYEVEFPEGTEYRYIRFRTLETWGGTSWVMLSELSFYGAESKN
ncbi:DUF5126 domain-containing protein [Prolixibacteraceae bacterium JC049]|nr:DUF5126 domain-containing protein [Prolixibacteraceae bacterium JC049]